MWLKVKILLMVGECGLRLLMVSVVKVKTLLLMSVVKVSVTRV